ncbi:MAG: hypothetical protein HOG90_02595 [Betaproteobacteria bacterium]|jgi:hypothetical protein|nr:hypothetical protein [Betaproteobacteria bacterium]
MFRYVMNNIILVTVAFYPVYAKAAETQQFLDETLSIPVSSTYNRVIIDQIGAQNIATVTSTGAASQLRVSQEGNDQVAVVKFVGSENSGLLRQKGGELNEVTIDVDGNTNSFKIVQQKNSVQGKVFLTQLGERNTAVQKQRGKGNQMGLLQDGNDNVANMDQRGRNRTMELTQLGDGNIMYLKQTNASDRVIRVTQIGGAKGSIYQTD